jgi:hypothetical protein
VTNLQVTPLPTAGQKPADVIAKVKELSES